MTRFLSFVAACAIVAAEVAHVAMKERKRVLYCVDFISSHWINSQTKSSESEKFFKLAKREADYVSELPAEVSIEKLIDSFLISNPNSRNWHKKGNKLSY